MDATHGAQHSGTQVDDPRSYIPGDRRRALLRGESMPDRIQGAALFADVSGFTPLTEALVAELGPDRGAEELVKNLDVIFAAVIADLVSHGGEVLYFSGDAITGWIDGDDGTRATACAVRMQSTFDDVGRITTAAGTEIDLAIKIAIAVGPARRFVVGDPAIQLHDVLAGSLIDDLAAAESLAEKGEIVLDQSVVESLGSHVDVGAARTGPTERTGSVLTALHGDPVPLGEVPPLEPLEEDVVRQWLLPTVYERLSGGGGALFGELRTVFPMFVRFGGIDYDEDRDAAEKLDRFIRESQRILDSYGGNLLQLTLGDKGAYLYAVFGSPRAHENDAVRAVRAALDLLELSGTGGAEDLQIGLGTGQVFSGTYGHPTRRTFACLGDPVNLSARLMGRSPPGEIYASAEVMAATGDRFVSTALEPLPLKGKAEAVLAFSVQGRRQRPVSRHLRYPLPIVGREEELGLIDERLQDALRRVPSVVGVTADAGLGKSRLVAEVLRTIRAAGHRVAFGEAQAFGLNTSYLIWREPWTTLFELADGDRDGNVTRIERHLASIDPALVVRAPLLSGVLGIEIPDNAVTASFDAKLRKTSLENLLADVLRAEVQRQPLVLVLEDCQWIDQASLDLLEVLVRAAEQSPVLFLAAYRSDIAESAHERIRALASFEELVLRELNEEQIGRVIGSKLEQQFGAGVSASQPAIELITSRGQGNPFYIEELVNYLKRKDIDIGDPAAVKDLDLPPSLHALVLSRVDTLDEGPRRTLKVASVVGRSFEPTTLPEVYPQLGSTDEVSAHVDSLREADLVTPDKHGHQSWIFRHAVAQSVAYESIPYSLRSRLHEATGRYFEQRAPEQIELRLDLLAHHFWHSENLEKKVEYQRRAGDAAQNAYANAAAIEYFERLTTVVDEHERSRTLLKLGEVLELVGHWDRAERVEAEALELAEASGDADAIGWSEAALAEVARKQGRYDEVRSRLDRAARIFEKQGDDAGRGRVLHLAGTVAAQSGELDAARELYEESLRIREELGDDAGAASLLSNLGIVADYAGDVDASREFHERALTLRQAIGDRWAIANSTNNVGIASVAQERYAEARDLFAEALRLNEEVGDTWTVALNHNNLGNAYRGLGEGDEARHHYGESARGYRGYGDRWGVAFLLEDIAVLAASEGNSVAALELLGAADAMRAEIDAARSESFEADLENRVVDADPSLPEHERLSLRARGRSLDFDSALLVATEYCRC